MKEDNSFSVDHEDRNQKRPNEKVIAFIVRSIAVLLIMAMSGAIYKKCASSKERPKQRKSESSALRVNTEVVYKQKVNPIFKEFGTARPIRIVDVSAEVGGRITFVDPIVTVGGIVKKGQLLASIDVSDYKIALKQARAESSRISSDIKRLEILLEEDKRRVLSTQKNYDLSLKNYKRVEDLNKRNAISDTERDKVEQDLLVKDDALVALNAQIRVYPLQIEALKASLSSANSAADKAELNLRRCSLTAPFGGRIVKESIEKDQYYSRGMPLYSLADDSHIEINVPIISSDALKLGLKPASGENARYWIEGIEKIHAEIRWVESDKSVSIAGKAVRIDRIDAETRSIVLVIQPDKAKQSNTFLTAGMFCEVALKSNDEIDLVKIPRAAIQFESRIFTVDDNNTISSIIPDIHIRSDKWVYVLDDGLDKVRVVTSKLPFGLVDGMSVDPIDTAGGK